MTPEQYRAAVLAELDTTRTEEKDRIILGFIAALFSEGDPDHAISGADFIAEANRLLSAFHPRHLKMPEPETDRKREPDDIAF